VRARIPGYTPAKRHQLLTRDARRGGCSMGTHRRTIALCALGLIAAVGTGCRTSSPRSDRAEVPREIPAALDRKPPAWLTAGSAPLGPGTPDAAAATGSPVAAVPTDPADAVKAAQHLAPPGVIEVGGSTIPAPDPLEPAVPRARPAPTVTLETSGDGPVAPPAITPLPSPPPIRTPPSVEPDWKPAGGWKSP
jgi:hypothetical protein